MTPAALEAALARFPRVRATHAPTPLEPAPRLGAALGIELFVKRDDCTGVAFGGNKVRQLEFYLGAAKAAAADVVLITSAVQSNFMRAAAAMAARCGMDASLQLEDRVAGMGALYRENGNALLDRLLGATFESYPEGEDEAGADRAVAERAEALRQAGRRPYQIPLAADQPPLGALGYVVAAIEVAAQLEATGPVDEIFVGSGSALTHAGLLTGLRTLGLDVAVTGVCVRRDAAAQTERVARRVKDLEAMLGLPHRVAAADIRLDDSALAPGYGRLNDASVAAIRETAKLEGLFLDPVYTGKAMAALIRRARAGGLTGKRALFWHTGGQPALFAYADRL